MKSEISGDNLESASSSGGRRMLGGKWAVWGCGQLEHVDLVQRLATPQLLLMIVNQEYGLGAARFYDSFCFKRSESVQIFI